MKRFYGRMVMVALAVLSITAFTSCDEDVEEAMMISGEWSGDFGMYYETRHPRTGMWYTFYADYTNLVFYPHHEYGTYGTGRQYDYYREGPYAYQYYEFDWEVRNGVIYMDYPWNPELSVAISDYRISYDRFSGWIGDTKFNLYKLRDFGWDDYDYGYGYNDGWYWDDYYYSKTRSGEGTDSTDSYMDGIRFGNRFMEGATMAK